MTLNFAANPWTVTLDHPTRGPQTLQMTLNDLESTPDRRVYDCSGGVRIAIAGGDALTPVARAVGVKYTVMLYASGQLVSIYTMT